MSKYTLPLENKVALVTGVAGAIGYGICEVFLENGCTIVATDLPGEKLDTFASGNMDWGLKAGQTTIQGCVAALREVLEDPLYKSSER